MSDKIIQLNEDLIKHDLKDLVRSSVEETLNALLDKEADELPNGACPHAQGCIMPAESRENPLLKKGNSDAFFKEKYLTKNS